MAKSIAAGIFLVALVAVSLFLRAAPFRGIPPQNLSLITDPDSAYHLRVAQLIDADYPRVPAFDSYLNYPAGADIPWSFLQEFLTVTVRRLFFEPGERTLEILCFWYPAVMGSLSLVLVFHLGRLLGLSRIASGLAASFASLSPAQVAYTTAGRFDHNSGDLLFATLFFVALLTLWRERTSPAGSFAGVAPACGLALSGVLLFLNWTGAPIYIIVAAAAFTALVAVRRRDPLVPVFLSRLAAALTTAAALLAAAHLLAYGAQRLARIESGLPSGFQPLFLLAAALFAGALAIWSSRGARALRSTPLVATVAALSVVAGIIVSSLWHGFSYFLMADNRPMMSISECRSPFVDSHSDLLNPRFSLAAAGNSLSWAVFLLPVFAGAIGKYGLERRGKKTFPLLLYFSFLGVFTLMTVRQNRYGTMLSIPVALGAAWLATWLWERPNRGGSFIVRRVPALLLVALVALAYYPGVVYVARRFKDPYYNLGNYGIMRAARHLAESTPPPSDLLDRDQPPEYGVLAAWDIGNNIIATGRRPVVATGFLDTLPGDSFWESVRFFTEADPEAAWGIMSRNRLRYVVLHNHAKTLLLSYYTLGRDDLYARLLAGGKSALYRSGAAPVSLRLWDEAGTGHVAAGRVIPGARHFRLLWEDFFFYPGDSSVDQTKIYQAVPGARIIGKAAPGTLMGARLPLVSNLGKSFVYLEAATAGPDGRFELVVPYASGQANGSVRPAGPYQVAGWADATSIEVTVGERDVLEGRAVIVDGQGAP